MQKRKNTKRLIAIISILILLTGIHALASASSTNQDDIKETIGRTGLGSSVVIDGKNWVVIEKRTINQQHYAMLIIYGDDYGRSQFRSDGQSATLGGNTLQAAMDTAYSKTSQMKTIAVIPNLTAEGWQGVTSNLPQTPGIGSAPTAAMAGNRTNSIFFALSHHDVDRVTYPENGLSYSSLVGGKSAFWLRSYNLQTYPSNSNIYAMYAASTHYHQFTTTNSSMVVAPAVWVKYADDTQATINVSHVDRNSGANILPTATYKVSPGAYGPYYPESIPGYSIGTLQTNSDPASGTIGASQTRNITFVYEPSRTVTGRVWPMLASDIWGIGSSFVDSHKITVELRPTFLTPARPNLSTRAILIDSSGLGEFTIDYVPFGNYILHISRPGYLTRAMLVTVSASDPFVKTLSSPGTGENGVFNLWWGDSNDDGRIDNEDVMMILELMDLSVNANHPLYYSGCDFNGDGLIDNEDIQMVLETWNRMLMDYPGTNGVDPFS